MAAAPTAEAGCIATSIVFTAEMYPTPPTQPWDDLWVGQQLIPLITVQAADGTTPTGIVTVTDDTSQTCNFASPTNIGVTPLPCAFSYLTPTSGTPHYFTVTYQPNNATTCYFPSEAGMWMAVVKAGTVTTITGVNPEPSYVGDDVVVNFNVRAENPGAGVPTSGTGTVSDGHGRTCSDNNLRPNADGINMDGTCTIRRGWNSTGTYDLYATYSGNASYNGSTSPTVPHIVIEIVPTQVIPPTVVPSVCPRIDGGSFPSGNTFRMAATNPNANNTGGENDFTISQVRLAWPWNSPVMKLQSACVAGGNCPLSGVSIDPQPNNTLVTLAPWNSANAKLSRGSSINLDFTFNNPTLSGSYIVEVQFTDGRGRVCTAGPLTYSK